MHQCRGGKRIYLNPPSLLRIPWLSQVTFRMLDAPLRIGSNPDHFEPAPRSVTTDLPVLAPKWEKAIEWVRTSFGPKTRVGRDTR